MTTPPRKVTPLRPVAKTHNAGDTPDYAALLERGVTAIEAHTTELQITNGLLKDVVGTADGTLKLIKQWVPWVITGASIMWPTVGHVIDVVSKTMGAK